MEHADLIQSIRSGKPLNEGRTVAEATLTAIIGRMSAYTGMPIRSVAMPGQTEMI